MWWIQKQLAISKTTPYIISFCPRISEDWRVKSFLHSNFKVTNLSCFNRFCLDDTKNLSRYRYQSAKRTLYEYEEFFCTIDNENQHRYLSFKLKWRTRRCVKSKNKLLSLKEWNYYQQFWWKVCWTPLRTLELQNLLEARWTVNST